MLEKGAKSHTAAASTGKMASPRDQAPIVSPIIPDASYPHHRFKRLAGVHTRFGCLCQNDLTGPPDLIRYLQVFSPCLQLGKTCLHFLKFGFHLLIRSFYAIKLGLEQPEIAGPSRIDAARAGC